MMKLAEKIAGFGETALFIDGTKTVEQAIAEGKYDWIACTIKFENFPDVLGILGKKYKASVKLFPFEFGSNSEQAIALMDREGFRPANSLEILAFGALYPELQRKVEITALGSIRLDARYVRYVLCLCGNRKSRGLNLPWFVGGIKHGGCALGVRK